MIDNDKLQGIYQIFGSELPQRNLFFATRQTQEFITPGVIKSFYHEPALPKAYAKFVKDYEAYAQTQQQPEVPKPKPVPVLKDKVTTVTKDA